MKLAQIMDRRVYLVTKRLASPVHISGKSLQSCRAKTGSRKDQDLVSKDLLTAKEVAKMLSISVKTVYSYASRDLPMFAFSRTSGF